jgi:hypothetical protein
MLAVRLTRGFFRSSRHLAPAGSSTARKVAVALKGLAHEPVPAGSDAEDFLPPTIRCWARRVPDTALALMFERRGDDVLVLALRVWP